MRPRRPCGLCGSNEVNVMIFGELGIQDRHMLHRSCLILAMGKFVQTRNPSSFFRKDLPAEKRRIKLVECSYCDRQSANLSCAHAGCSRTFHTKCGVENLAVLQYGGKFNCFCAQHAPEHRSRPEPEEHCVLCLAPVVPEGKPFSPALAFQAPCCQNGWFHRACAQEQSNLTIYSFRCPLCRDERKYSEVAMFGVFVPKWRFNVPSPPAAVLSQPEAEAEARDGDRDGAVRRGRGTTNTRPVPYRGRARRTRTTRYRY